MEALAKAWAKALAAFPKIIKVVETPLGLAALALLLLAIALISISGRLGEWALIGAFAAFSLAVVLIVIRHTQRNGNPGKNGATDAVPHPGGQRHSIVVVLIVEGDKLRLQGFKDQAYAKFNEALYIAGRQGDRNGEATAHHRLGVIARSLGQTDQARRHYDAALPLFRAEQDRLGEANTYFSMAELAMATEPDEALKQFERAVTLCASIDQRDWQSQAREKAENFRNRPA
ncbi:MAG: tetratricopeptide repeat protein [Alphaproteobacteria bacterium]|nr:tetratricopeptide repeat protein [Alphaproteobacteria bacterium]